MEREKLISCCKYYKGEKNPLVFNDQNKKMLWFYEREWVLSATQPPDFMSMADEYETFPTKYIDKDNKVPYSLKVLLFNRYCTGCMGEKEDTAKAFDDFLLRYYY